MCPGRPRGFRFNRGTIFHQIMGTVQTCLEKNRARAPSSREQAEKLSTGTLFVGNLMGESNLVSAA